MYTRCRLQAGLPHVWHCVCFFGIFCLSLLCPSPYDSSIQRRHLLLSPICSCSNSGFLLGGAGSPRAVLNFLCTGTDRPWICRCLMNGIVRASTIGPTQSQSCQHFWDSVHCSLHRWWKRSLDTCQGGSRRTPLSSGLTWPWWCMFGLSGLRYPCHPW